MYDPRHVYAYDIETMNDADRGFHGLDPSRSYVTEIAVATDESINGGGEVFQGREETIFGDFARFVASLRPGLMASWNGTFFDNPFINYRAMTVGVDVGMVLHAQPGLRPKYDPLPTSATPENPNGGWSAQFTAAGGVHASLDVADAYRGFADDNGVKWGLKPVCEAVGIDMFTLPDGFTDFDDYRQRLVERPATERKAYAMSDSVGTRVLAMMLLGLDRVPGGVL